MRLDADRYITIRVVRQTAYSFQDTRIGPIGDTVSSGFSGIGIPNPYGPGIRMEVASGCRWVLGHLAVCLHGLMALWDRRPGVSLLAGNEHFKCILVVSGQQFDCSIRGGKRSALSPTFLNIPIRRCKNSFVGGKNSLMLIANNSILILGTLAASLIRSPTSQFNSIIGGKSSFWSPAVQAIR